MANDYDGTIRWRAGPSGGQDHNMMSDQCSRSAEDFNLEEQGTGNRSNRIWPDVHCTRPDVPISASDSGLKLRTRISGSKSIDGEDHFNESDDRYEGRYERLWREGERHYLTSGVSCGWGNLHGRKSVVNQTSKSGNKPSHSNSIKSNLNQAGQKASDIDNRKGGLDGTTACDLQRTNEESGVHRPSTQSATCVPIDEYKPASGQVGRSDDVQGQPHIPEDTSSGPWFNEDEIDARRQVHWHNAFAKLNGIEPKRESSTNVEPNKQKRFSSFTFLHRPPSQVSRNLEDLSVRRNFLLKLAKALLYFGAPPHRIESQLIAADAILNTRTEIVYLPNIVIITMHGTEQEEATRTYFVRSKGRLALTSLHSVHLIYRDVLHDRMSSGEGIDGLKRILRAPPIYPLKFRCFLALVCSSIICVLAFGGSAVDMFISGICASILQYLGLSAANKSSMYANVYEISVSIFVAFVARGLSSIPGHVFCYSAISSAGVVLILPGFTVLISSLELMSKNIFCGSVRIVYAIIYTLFLGFGLTIGSDFYLVLDRHARRQYYHSSLATNLTYTHGQFVFSNSTLHHNMVNGVIGTVLHKNHTGDSTLQVIKGCIRDDSWSWWRRPFPWYAVFILVPLYSTCSSLSNLQSWRSIQLPVMVTFSCAAFAANKATSVLLPGRTDIVSAAGAFVIGLLGNIYSRVIRGTAFTSMVTGVLFLVPSGIAQGGGLNQNYRNSSEQYSVGFSLALRMISLASGVTVGLFVSQVLVYLFGSRKNGAHFAF